MNNILKYSSLLLCCLALASCVKDAPSKSEVESSFKKYDGELPTVSIKATPKEINAIDGYVAVEVTFTGLYDDLSALSVGVLSDTDPTFKSAFFTPAGKDASGKFVDGTFTINARVLPNRTFYIRGVAASNEGTSYSEVMTVAVPDIPFYLKVLGTYTSTLYSNAGKEDLSCSITIIRDENDPENSCFVADIEPYWAGEGYTYKATNGALNYCQATIDNDANTITIADGADIHFAGRIIRGFDSAKFADSKYYAPVVFRLAENGSDLALDNGFMTITSDGQAEDAYDAGVTFTKK